MKNNYLTKKLFCVLLPLLFLSNKGNAQYTVSAIPHQAYTLISPTPLFNVDDRNSPVVTLPFNFTFYGNTYNQLVVSSNGYIDFRTSLANQNGPWQITTTIPNLSFQIKNAILACYHDLNNGNATGTISYSVVGAAPYRKFILMFIDQPHYGGAVCSNLKSTFQTVLYETLNTIDVQIISKPVCTAWNSGNAITGIVNESGTIALTPPGRNTGAWAATQEGWRFSLPSEMNTYKYTKCDPDLDGTAAFDLQVVIDDLSAPFMTFHHTLSDAQNQVNEIQPLIYHNPAAYEEIMYGNNNGQIIKIILRAIDCNVDYDLDTIATASEDLNGDGNLENDDTDGDGIPNFLDNDDDGDMILTSFEYVFASGRNSNSTNSLLDTDNDGIPNYLDNDDDGDGVLTINEDYNRNNNPADDDTNNNGLPDYLEMAVALGVDGHNLNSLISLYPNPVSNTLNIDNRTNEVISNIAIYSINGMLVKQVPNAANTTSIPVSELQTGMYFVKMEVGNQVMNYKFIKK
ncbi:T9SS type A sorting domain-containing protein [Flavobacterium microcysteis]|uniref:T9SS type A sorting domain-containing protein n=1 Tax=Flavobacterium microcysteis TaxID=2596891 RepID=A0A501QA34_9FLAO|nr:T9SS type A sorting domain-containing protein [Flavobacterium microcysteis]TPD69769.1 T9SS type A sorting domain-containing protein [Flavobacterium microcysteis]